MHIMRNLAPQNCNTHSNSNTILFVIYTPKLPFWDHSRLFRVFSSYINFILSEFCAYAYKFNKKYIIGKEILCEIYLTDSSL